jgi:hypothetical protein
MKSFGIILKLNKLYEEFVPVKANLDKKFISRAWITPEGEYINLGEIGKNSISHNVVMRKYPKLFNIENPKDMDDYTDLQNLGFIRTSAYDDQVSFNPLVLTEEGISSLLKWIDAYYKNRTKENGDLQIGIDLPGHSGWPKTVKSQSEAEKIIINSRNALKKSSIYEFHDDNDEDGYI